MSDDIPAPLSVPEFQEWIQELNGEFVQTGKIKDAREQAHEAVDASFDALATPHAERARYLLAGIKRYVIEHETSLKKNRGREFTLGPGTIKFRVAQPAVETTSEAETVRGLIANGFDKAIRYEPKVDKTELKGMKRTDKLMKVLNDTGAYIARHQFATLALPSLDKPIELFKHRYPRRPRPISIDD